MGVASSVAPGAGGAGTRPGAGLGPREGASIRTLAAAAASVRICTAAPRTLARPPELPDERLIARREREVPDQLSAGRLGKPAQLRQLIF